MGNAELKQEDRILDKDKIENGTPAHNSSAANCYKFKNRFICEICNLPVSLGDRMCYTDTKRNLKDAPIHQECYYKHIFKYFPNSLLVKRLKSIKEIQIAFNL